MKENEEPAVHRRGDGSQKPAPRSRSQFRFGGEYTEVDVLRTVHRTPQRYVGIKASIAAKDSPAAPIGQTEGAASMADRSIESIDFALTQAMQWWPGVADWSIIAADLLFDQKHTADAGIPPGMVLMRDPVDVLDFMAANDRRGD